MIMRRHLPMFLLTVALAGCAWPVPWRSQKSPMIDGRVVDAKDQRPLDGVTVAFVGEPSRRTVTKDGGWFSFRETQNLHWMNVQRTNVVILPPGSYSGDELEVTMDGYKPVRLKASAHMLPGQTNQTGRGFHLADIALER